MFKDFKDYASRLKETYIEYIKVTKKKQTKIVISTWQSIYNLPKKWFKQFGTVIGDEAHLFKAVSLTKIMTKLEKCPHRIGLTGTLDGSKTHKLVLEGLFGAVNKVVSTSELQEKGKLAELKIFCLILQHGKNERKHCADFTYQEEMDYLVRSDERNKYIRNLASNLQGNTLCLFQYVEKHGETLYKMIKDKAEDKQVFMYMVELIQMKENRLETSRRNQTMLLLL